MRLLVILIAVWSLFACCCAGSGKLISQRFEKAKRELMYVSGPAGFSQAISSVRRLRELAQPKRVDAKAFMHQEEPLAQGPTGKAVRQEVDSNSCQGTIDDEGNCVCDKFRAGDLCEIELFARCKPRVLQPAVDAECSAATKIPEYDSKMDGFPPCVFVNASDVVDIVVSFNCSLVDPAAPNDSNAYSDRELLQSEVEGEFELRAVNWRLPYSDKRSMQRVSLTELPLSSGEYSLQFDIAQLRSWDEGYTRGGRVYLEGIVEGENLQQNCWDCVTRVFLDIDGYEFPESSGSSFPLWAIYVIAFGVGILVLAVAVYIFAKLQSRKRQKSLEKYE